MYTDTHSPQIVFENPNIKVKTWAKSAEIQGTFFQKQLT